MLYAGKISQIYEYILNWKYVKKSYILINRQNLNNSLFNFSETKSNNNINYTLFKKEISEHIPNYYKPLNDEQLGHYLSGLIDGDGHFDYQNGNLIIAYALKDVQAAYWLKSMIGYGKISKIKDKQGYKYVLSHSEGLLYVLKLINNKLRTIQKYNQVINNLLCKNDLVNKLFYYEFDNFNYNKSLDFNNHWLSGFMDSDGSFQIKVINRKSRSKPEIRLKLQISQKNISILNDIKYFLCNLHNKSPIDFNNLNGCYIGKRIHNNNEDAVTYYFETTSFNINKNVINYFDHYPLVSTKYISYLYYRKVYILIKNREHLTDLGIYKIMDIKSKINK